MTTNSTQRLITVTPRKASERGLTELGWLTSRHSFSFGEYYDPRHMGFRTLRVINDDWVKAGSGFGMHGHRDMEIITIVVEGSLEHRDSLGHGAALLPSEAQVMTAGRGIRHSEFNPSKTGSAHFIQIWIEPEALGLEPEYSQRAFPPESSLDTLLRIAGPQTRDDSALTIHQDADVFVTNLSKETSIEHTLRQGRGVWIQVIKGTCSVNEHTITDGDALALEGVGTITLRGIADSTALILFDLR